MPASVVSVAGDPAAARPAMIELKGLVKRYGGFVAVNGIDLTVHAGEVFGFLGPNGAGKTTTMKMIAGLIRPTAGEIRVDGVDLRTEPFEAKRRIGYIPDRPFIYEKLTGQEFLEFLGGVYDIEPAEAARRGAQLLELFGLTGFAHSLVENYSHGMKQRLTIAGALMHRPKLIVVDEPMVGLDPQGTRLLKQIFRRICAEQGSTIFMSTHTLSDVEEMCDRVAILRDGKIVALGSMAELQAQYEGKRLEEVFLFLTGQGPEATSEALMSKG